MKTYRARGGEDALQQAYEFGRSAVFAGLGILDVAEIHHRAISAILLNRPPEEMAQGVKNAMIFFEESVSPFEITHRGYREAVDTIQRVINFAFMATHEIKAPLTSILSSAGILQEIF